MHFLITGGAGFIGSHLCETLLDNGEAVTVLDDLSSGSVENIAHLREHTRFRFVMGSVQERSLLAELIDECDAVYHLAAAVGVKLIVQSPVRTIQNNVHGTEVVLSLAAKKRKKVLVASTSEVYGLSQHVPFREDGPIVLGATTKGRWSYACSKAIDEFLALAYWREQGLPTIIVRLFNTVGPRQTGRYGMVLPTFVNQALAGEVVTVHGDGTQSRCFTHVADVVKALVNLIYLPAAIGEVINIGSREEITIEDLAHRVVSYTRSTSRIVHIPYSEAYETGFEDMPRRVPDISKAEAMIGFRPARHLEQILHDTVEFERRRAERPPTAGQRKFHGNSRLIPVL